MGQVPQDIVENVAHEPGVPLVPRGLPGLQRVERNLRLVVEHLLEVRHEPVLVHRVAVEAPADVVMDAAPRHLPQGLGRHPHRQAARLAAHPFHGGAAEQEGEVAGPWEFRRAAEAAAGRVEGLLEIPEAPAERLAGRGQRVRRGRGGPRDRPRLQRGHGALALRHKLGPLVAPAARDRREDGRKTGSAGAVLGGKVGPAVEGLQFRGEPDAERPAAVARQRLHVGHVDPVEVGALLPVHLDGHEVVA